MELVILILVCTLPVAAGIALEWVNDLREKEKVR
jgi:hypothetical protein